MWLGADLARSAWTSWRLATCSTTVEVDGTTLTVDDRRTRAARASTSSRRASRGGLRARLDAAPVVESMLTEGLRNPTSAQVCAYRREAADAASCDLVYATTLGEQDATAYHAQVYDGGFESAPDFCGGGRTSGCSSRSPATTPTAAGSEVTQATVVDPACREVSGSPGMVTPAQREGHEGVVARTALQVTLYGLIGPLG